MSSEQKTAKVSLLVSSVSYFNEVVQAAIEKRGFEASPLASQYIVKLLDSFMLAENVPRNTSLAETLLKASQAERKTRQEMLKRLGDVSLYISGFFGDSLNRKIVDIDYYADIGGVAYGQLAKELEPDSTAGVYGEFSTRFLEFVDLLTYISQSSLVQSNRDLLRLYDRYVKTGSELAREQLLENGLLTTEQLKKVNNQ
jgi:Mor family transcriptional regulator